MTRQTFWRTLTVAFAIIIASASLQSFAQSLPNQSDDVEGTLLSNNLLLPSPLQIPLPLRLATPAPITSNPPSAITSSVPLPSSTPLEAALEATPQAMAAPVTAAPQTSIAPVTLSKPQASPNQNKTPTLSSNTKPTTTTAKKPVPTKKPATKKPTAKKPTPAQKPRTTSSNTSRVSTRSGPSFYLKSTGYNSATSQTDSSPRVTATGARTRFGIIAVSRDLLRSIPYGSQVSIEDMGSLGSGSGRGRFNNLLNGVVFIVEDTMNKRITRTVDVWFTRHSMAIQWGKRQVKLTILRYGRR